MSNTCIVALIGLPGVGKTTWTKAIKEKLAKFNIIHVCIDQLIPLEVQTQVECKGQRKAILTAIKAILSKDQTVLSEESKTFYDIIVKERDDKDKVVIIIDDNNYYKSMRYEYYQLARSEQIGFSQFYFPVSSVQLAQESNQSRPTESRVPNEVISKMSSKLEPPNPLSNPWEQFSFTINLFTQSGERADFNVEMCQTVLEMAMENPVQMPPDRTLEVQMAREVCSQSLLHQVDKILRKQISCLMSDLAQSSKAEIKAKGQEMKVKKTEFLQDLKCGSVELPLEVVESVEKGEIKELQKLIEKLFAKKLAE